MNPKPVAGAEVQRILIHLMAIGVRSSQAADALPVAPSDDTAPELAAEPIG